MIDAKINTIIAENGLQAFYPANPDPNSRLNKLLQRLYLIDYNGLIRRLGLPSIEFAIDLVSVALYNVMILYDDSGSMHMDEYNKPSTEKVEDLVAFVQRVASISCMFDDDGIDILSFKRSKDFYGVTDPNSVPSLFQDKGVTYSGGTPLAESIENKILKPHVKDLIDRGGLTKPVIIYIVTDGAPDSQRAVYETISNMKQRLIQTSYGRKAVVYAFLQVGRDKKAQAFLAQLDNDKGAVDLAHPESVDPKAIGDVVDATSYCEDEEEEYRKKGIELTPGMYLNKACLGAIDRSYDEQDE